MRIPFLGFRALDSRSLAPGVGSGQTEVLAGPAVDLLEMDFVGKAVHSVLAEAFAIGRKHGRKWVRLSAPSVHMDCPVFRGASQPKYP